MAKDLMKTQSEMILSKNKIRDILFKMALPGPKIGFSNEEAKEKYYKWKGIQLQNKMQKVHFAELLCSILEEVINEGKKCEVVDIENIYSYANRNLKLNDEDIRDVNNIIFSCWEYGQWLNEFSIV